MKNNGITVRDLETQCEVLQNNLLMIMFNDRHDNDLLDKICDAVVQSFAPLIAKIKKHTLIQPENNVYVEFGSNKGDLFDITKVEIDKILGFTPNNEGDSDKVTYQWGFTFNGNPCIIYDWKDSYMDNKWKWEGDKSTMIEIFGEHRIICY